MRYPRRSSAPRAILVTAVLILATAHLSGCVLVAVGAGAAGVAYVNGEFEAVLDAGPPRVVDAAAAALEEMEVEIQPPERSALDGRVVGRTALGKKVEITVKRQTETTSKLWIRIDTFGDEDLSRQIYERIRAKL
jgi:hypothetical protein